MSTTEHGSSADVTWEPPGPGHWELDLSHCLGSMTPIMQDVQSTGATNGMRELFALYGMPADTLDAKFVNGYFYTRIRPLLAPDRPAKKAPPAFVLKVAFKVHPELRRRAKRAAETLADKPWRPAMRAWEDHERTAFETENLALQDVDLSSLDDAGLAAHYEDTLAALRRGYHRHFVLHGYDLGPIGFLLVACQRWGIDGVDVVPTLQGASPATSEPAACWPGCEPRWRPAAPRRPRSTRSGPSHPRRRPRSTSTSATAACRCSAATTSTASPSASCPRWCWRRSSTGARPTARTTPRPARQPCASGCRSRSGPRSTICSPRPASP